MVHLRVINDTPRNLLGGTQVFIRRSWDQRWLTKESVDELERSESQAVCCEGRFVCSSSNLNFQRKFNQRRKSDKH
jgi:hypothetical protein